MSRYIVVDIETTEYCSLIGTYDPDQQKFEQVAYTKASAIETLHRFSQYDAVIGFNIAFDLAHIFIMAMSRKELQPTYVSSYLIDGDRSGKLYLSKEDADAVQKIRFRSYEIPNLIDAMALAQIFTVQENGGVQGHKRSLKYFSAILLYNLIMRINFEDDTEDRLYEYNRQDLEATWEIFKICKPVYDSQKMIGDRFQINMCAKTNSSMILPLVTKLLGHEPKKVVPIEGRYYDDRFIGVEILARYLSIFDKIQTGQLPKNTVTLPLFPKMNVVIGLGGVHAISTRILYPNVIDYDRYQLLDIDITSQYPTVYTQLQGVFHSDVNALLKRLLEERKEMKRSGSGCKATIGAYKILLNGIYGKLSTAYDSLFLNPVGLLRVTTSGQLMILYAAHMMFNAGYDVVYLNTDGLTILVPKDADVERITALAKEHVNRFFKDVEIETKRYEKGVFFNVNSYGLKEVGVELYKFKKDFRTTITRAQPNLIAKILQKRFFGIEYEVKHEDVIFVKTSKNGIAEHGQIIFGYFCKNLPVATLWGKEVWYIHYLDEFDMSEVDLSAYEERADEIVALSEGFDDALTEEEQRIMQDDMHYYMPVKKNGGFYKGFEWKGPFFENPIEHNQYVVLNCSSVCANYRRMCTEEL